MAINKLINNIMETKTFTIPEGCKVVHVTEAENKITIEFEPIFKQGDIVVTNLGSVAILKSITPAGWWGTYASLNQPGYFTCVCHSSNISHLASKEEAQRLFDSLAKDGKRWNPETMEVEPIEKKRWRAEKDEMYYTITSDMYIMLSNETFNHADFARYNSGNYFKNKQQAERALVEVQATLVEVKAALDRFWEKELNNNKV